MIPLHNVLFVQYVFLQTKHAETYLKIYVLAMSNFITFMNLNRVQTLRKLLTYICPSLFGWKENMIFEETVIFKL